MERFNPSVWGVFDGTVLVYLSFTPIAARKFADRKNRDGCNYEVKTIPIETEIK